MKKVGTILRILILTGVLLLLDVFRLEAQEYMDFERFKTESQNIIIEKPSPTVHSMENSGNINSYMNPIISGNLSEGAVDQFAALLNDVVLEESPEKISRANLQAENMLPSADMDIYLLIGQSNMAGRGEVGDYADSVLPNVYLFNGKDWQPASNPLNRFSTVKKDIKQGLGPGYSFAQKLSEKSRKTIGLIVNARGGTSLEQWQKGFDGKEDFDLYEEAVVQVRKINNSGKLQGIIWHQGESNQSNYSNYLELLKKLVSDLRADLEDGELLFVAGELGNWRASSEAINKIIRSIPDNIPRAHYVTAEGLWPLKNDLTDSHFDGPSQRILGERYADKVMEMLADFEELR